MTRTRTLLAASLVALCFALLPNSAQAQGVGGYGNAWLYPGYWYNVYGMESIPYFSLHPPVYYSRPVPRPYGWSPFAYPPGTFTPEPEVVVQPQVMRNPHVEQSSTSDDRVTAVQPLRIRNPYVTEAQLSRSN